MNGEGVCALVGVVGGAGTTRLTLEYGATLARDGRSVAVVDTAYATQGLSTAVSGPIGTDVTAAVTEQRPLADAAVDLDLDVPGRVVVAPARAPFERFSRAMTSACARRLAEGLATAAREYDHVLVDVAPVATNPTVAAVTAADRVVTVVPDSQRGTDALVRTRDRLADIDAAVDAVVATEAEDKPLVEAADATVPTSETTSLPDAPVAVEPSEFATAVGAAVTATLDVDLDLETASSSLLDYL
jgi:cellulose biosynthesis protein BcsQ